MRQHFDIPFRQMYQRLYQQSRRARYDGWYPSAGAYDQLKRMAFQPIKEKIEQLVRFD